jgi:hypothetical protein
MAVPKLPTFDAKSFVARLKELKPAPVFDQFLGWKIGVDGQRDVVARHDVQLSDHKGDLDAHSERLNRHADRLAALEARPVSTFP